MTTLLIGIIATATIFGAMCLFALIVNTEQVVRDEDADDPVPTESGSGRNLAPRESPPPN